MMDSFSRNLSFDPRRAALPIDVALREALGNTLGRGVPIGVAMRLRDDLFAAGLVLSEAGMDLSTTVAIHGASESRIPVSRVSVTVHLRDLNVAIQHALLDDELANDDLRDEYLPNLLAREAVDLVQERIVSSIRQHLAPEGPFELWWLGRCVGTVPTDQPQSASAMYDVRPGDFRTETRDGKRVIVASDLLGAGDIEAIKGFVFDPEYRLP